MDVRFYLSGGAANTDPDLALGGAKSTQALTYNSVSLDTTTITGLTVLDAGGIPTGKTFDVVYNFETLALRDNSGYVGTPVSIPSNGTYLLEASEYTSTTTYAWVLVSVDRSAWPLTDGLDDPLTITPILNNIFDDVLEAESQSGMTDYRCLYLQNNDATTTVTVKLWLQTLSGPDFWYLATDAAGLNGLATTIADENTSPAGATFSQPLETSPMVFTLAPGEYMPVWFKRLVNALNFASGARQIYINMRLEY